MKKPFLTLLILFIFSGVSFAQISVDSFTTPDDVTIENLETFRTTVVDAINAFDGSLVQDGTIPADALDANANPENRWNEAFNDFVYTGLTIPTSESLSSTTTSGTAYINGTRVVKDATAHTYTASRWTFVDLSSNGTYTYSEVAIDGATPSVATNSIRLARVSTDETTVVSVSDERVTEINVAAGSAGSLADTDADTTVQTEESDDEDIIRFALGDTTLGSAKEVLVISAIDGTYSKIYPGSDDETDLGDEDHEFRNLFVDGYASIDSLTAGIYNVTATGEIFCNSSDDQVVGISTQGNSGEFLQSQGPGAYPVFSRGARMDVFTSSGTFTVPTGVTKVYLTMCGAGGGGGGSNADGNNGAGGGGGGECTIMAGYGVTPAAELTVTVGAAGAGGSAGANGSNGGDTVFDTLTVSGGGGGNSGANGGAGGSGASANANLNGSDSSDGNGAAAGTFYSFAGGDGGAGTGVNQGGGGGGSSMLGLGGAGGDTSAGGSAATGYGAGGGGAGDTGTDKTGGSGSAGVVIVYY